MAVKLFQPKTDGVKEVKDPFVTGVFTSLDNGYGQKSTKIRLRADDKLYLRFHSGNMIVRLDGNFENEGILGSITIEPNSTLRSEIEPLKASFGEKWIDGISTINVFLKPLIQSELEKRKALLKAQPVVEAQDEADDIDSLF